MKEATITTINASQRAFFSVYFIRFLPEMSRRYRHMCVNCCLLYQLNVQWCSKGSSIWNGVDQKLWHNWRGQFGLDFSHKRVSVCRCIHTAGNATEGMRGSIYLQHSGSRTWCRKCPVENEKISSDTLRNCRCLDIEHICANLKHKRGSSGCFAAI